MSPVRFGSRAALVSALAALPWAVAAQGADIAAGKVAYEGKCGGCHSVDANRIGPLHRNLLGRRIASAPGYSYSPALRRVTGVWTAARLNAWLQNPQALAPGTKMYLTVPDPAQRAAIIAYLQSVSSPPARR